MVLNSPCFIVKSWLVQDQTVSGKDISNLLIADSLLKTIWLSMHHVIRFLLGLVQATQLRKQADIHKGGDDFVLSTQEYIRKVVEDVGEDEDFKGGSWVSTVEFVNSNGGIVNGCLGDIKNYLNNEKLEQVVAIIKSRTPNVLDDLTVILKDLSGVIDGIFA
ncbi:hypothetical protein Tco_0015070 [Tanacetum coccineum]